MKPEGHPSLNHVCFLDIGTGKRFLTKSTLKSARKEKIDGVEVHRYGPHIFHTQDADVWAFVNRFAKFNHYRHRGLVRQHNRLYSFPINLMTLHQVWGVSTPLEAQRRLAAVREL